MLVGIYVACLTFSTVIMLSITVCVMPVSSTVVRPIVRDTCNLQSLELVGQVFDLDLDLERLF